MRWIIATGCCVTSILVLAQWWGMSGTGITRFLGVGVAAYVAALSALVLRLRGEVETPMRRARGTPTVASRTADAVAAIRRSARISSRKVKPAYVVRLAHNGETESTTRCRVYVGRFTIDFELTRVAGVIRAYILTTIDYAPWSAGCHDTHRHSDAGRPYVCTDKPILDFDTAHRWAGVWAQYTEFYLENGRAPTAAETAS